MVIQKILLPLRGSLATPCIAMAKLGALRYVHQGAKAESRGSAVFRPLMGTAIEGYVGEAIVVEDVGTTEERGEADGRVARAENSYRVALMPVQHLEELTRWYTRRERDSLQSCYDGALCTSGRASHCSPTSQL